MFENPKFNDEYVAEIVAALPGKWEGEIINAYLWKEQISLVRDDGLKFTLDRIPTGTSDGIRFEVRASSIRDTNGDIVSLVHKSADGERIMSGGIGPAPNWGNPMEGRPEALAAAIVRRFLKDYEPMYKATIEIRDRINQQIDDREWRIHEIEDQGWKRSRHNGTVDLYKPGYSALDIRVNMLGKIDMTRPITGLSLHQLMKIAAIIEGNEPCTAEEQS